MSKFSLAAVSAVLLLLLASGIAVAQESQVAQERDASDYFVPMKSGAVGLLDVGYVIKNYPPFSDSMAELKLEVEKAEEEVKQWKSELENLKEQLNIHPLGTDEHATLEDRITEMSTRITSDVAREKRDFLRHEARIYHETYQEVVGQSERYAKHNGIVMVLRFSRDEVNANDPKSVLTHINQPIVWYDQDRDITDAVLKRLIERSKEGEEEPETNQDKPEDKTESQDEEKPSVGAVPPKSVAVGD